MDGLRISLIIIGILILMLLYWRGKNSVNKEQSIFSPEDEWYEDESDPLSSKHHDNSRQQQPLDDSRSDTADERYETELPGEITREITREIPNDKHGRPEPPIIPSAAPDDIVDTSRRESISRQSVSIASNVTDDPKTDMQSLRRQRDDGKDMAKDVVKEMVDEDAEQVENETLPQQPKIPGFDRFSHETKKKDTYEEVEESDALVIVISVMAKDDGIFTGGQLLHAFDGAGLKYCVSKTYQYFRLTTESLKDNNSMPAMFNVLNMLNPGTFPSKLGDNFETTGIALVLQLPSPYDASESLRVMHNVAQALASDLKGKVCDESRNPLTKQAYNHMREQVSDYTRRRFLH